MYTDSVVIWYRIVHRVLGTLRDDENLDATKLNTMKRADWEKKRDDYATLKVKQLKHMNKWNWFIHKYSKDAPAELMAVYERLTGENIGTMIMSKECLHNADEDTLYIYNHPENGQLVYGPDMIPYPFEDKSLWPWTVSQKAIPTLPIDLFRLFVSYMAPRDRLAFGMTCRRAREIIQSEANWKDWRDYMHDNVVMSRPTLDVMPTWRMFSLLQYLGQYGHLPKGHTSMSICWFFRIVLNLYAPFGHIIQTRDNVLVTQNKKPVTYQMFISINGTKFGIFREQKCIKIHVSLGTVHTKNKMHMHRFCSYVLTPLTEKGSKTGFQGTFLYTWAEYQTIFKSIPK